jgi:hypothetical protein
MMTVLIDNLIILKVYLVITGTREGKLEAKESLSERRGSLNWADLQPILRY